MYGEYYAEYAGVRRQDRVDFFLEAISQLPSHKCLWSQEIPVAEPESLHKPEARLRVMYKIPSVSAFDYDAVLSWRNFPAVLITSPKSLFLGFLLSLSIPAVMSFCSGSWERKAGWASPSCCWWGWHSPSRLWIVTRLINLNCFFLCIDVQASPVGAYGVDEVVDGGLADTKAPSPDKVWRWYVLQLLSHCFLLSLSIPWCRHVILFRKLRNKGCLSQP